MVLPPVWKMFLGAQTVEHVAGPQASGGSTRRLARRPAKARESFRFVGGDEATGLDLHGGDSILAGISRRVPEEESRGPKTPMQIVGQNAVKISTLNAAMLSNMLLGLIDQPDI